MPTPLRAALLRKGGTQTKACVRRSLRYPLQAWVEGHYARERGMPKDTNPYPGDLDMASAWTVGWLFRDQMSIQQANGKRQP